MDEKVSVTIALSLLKSGYFLYSIIDGVKYEFRYMNNLIYISSDNIHIKVDEYKFLEVYENNQFQLIENNEEIDILKDEEYYSWRK